MGKYSSSRMSELFGNLFRFIRICIFHVLSIGPIPNHFAFIMDGNRRYAKKCNMKEGAGHRAGFVSLTSILKYCYELGVKYVTIYALSIDNFKRSPDEVKDLMDLMLEKIEELLRDESIVNQYGIRIYFIGNLKLLSEPLRIAAEKAMRTTAKNTNCTLLICVAYTSRDEIVRAVQDSCEDKLGEIQPFSFHKAKDDATAVEDNKKINGVIPLGYQEYQKDEEDGSQATRTSAPCSCLDRGVEGGGNKNSMVMHAVQRSYEDKWDDYQVLVENRTTGNGVSPSEDSEHMQGECSIVKLVDIEKNMYMAVAPEPDILIRSSGETRLSNFLLWQDSDAPEG